MDGLRLTTALTATSWNTSTVSPGNRSFHRLWDSLISLNYNLPTMIVVAAVLFVVSVGTAFGNFLVGLALFKYRYLRTISNFLIGNLAVSDFLLATTILPLSTVNECLGHWIFGQVTCNIWLITDVLYCTASIWNLCVIAFDRYTATLYPIWYREKRSTRQAAVYVALVWIISSAICVPPLLGWNDLSQNYVYDNTTDVYYCMLFQTPSYVLYSASGSFYVPFFITFFFYVRIFVVLRRRMQKMRASNTRRHQPREPATEKSPLTVVTTQTDVTIEMTLKKKGASTEPDESSSRSFLSTDSGSDQGNNIVNQSTPKNVIVHFQPTPEQLSNINCPQEEDRVCEDSPSSKPPIRKSILARIINKQESKQLLLTSNGKKTQCITETDCEPELTPTSTPRYKNRSDSGRKRVDKMMKYVSRFTKSLTRDPGDSQTQQRRFEQREMQATIRMAIIIAFFCGMWLGFFTLYVLNSWCSSCNIPRELDAFFFWLGYSNSSVNPILYTIFNEEFRRAFQKILGCRKKRTLRNVSRV